MISHEVVAYPRFGDGDAAWVESVRKDHDPQFVMIRAHVTLSGGGIALGGLIDQIHVVSVAAVAITNVAAFDLGRLAFGGPA